MEWYEQEVRRLIRSVRNAPPPGEPVVFYGGSSVRLWGTLRSDFPGVDAVNLGFGGATLEACVVFFARLVAPCAPRALVVYAGDNDLGDGHSPSEVLDAFRALAEFAAALPRPPRLTFLSIKPSPARWGLMGEIVEANRLVAGEVGRRPSCGYVDVSTPMLGPDGHPRPELYAEDGLHLSDAGYALWTSVLSPRAHTIFSSLL